MARTFRPFRRQPPLVARRVWSAFVTPAYRRPPVSAGPRPLTGTGASFGLRLSLAGSPRRQAESRSLSYGRVVHLPLLPTSPRGECSYVRLRSSDPTSARTCTSRIQDTRKRTSPPLRGGSRRSRARAAAAIRPLWVAHRQNVVDAQNALLCNDLRTAPQGPLFPGKVPEKA